MIILASRVKKAPEFSLHDDVLTKYRPAKLKGRHANHEYAPHALDQDGKCGYTGTPFVEGHQRAFMTG